MDYRRSGFFVSLAMIALAFAACGGGGGGATAGVVPVQPSPGVVSGQASLVIKIPAPPPGTSARSGFYISPNTQSIGVVVSPQGLPTEPAQFVNVSSCPTVSGVVTCTINVTVWVGNDTFTITAYSGQNGTGSALSTGSVVANIVSGGTPPTVNVTLGGIISTIAIVPQTPILPLGQSTTLNVVARDASGATIVGTYPTPIALSATGLTISATSIADSTHASGVTIAWPYGAIATPSPVTITATGGSVTGTQTITPGSGFQLYQAGTNPINDFFGFKMIAANGKLYYTSGGQSTCTATLCTFSPSAVHQFDPATAIDTEIDMQGEMTGLKMTSDGALWIGGGINPTPSADPVMYRMAPGSFSAAALTTIAVPTASPSPKYAVRSFAQDASGNLWFQDLGGSRYLKIPVAGPYTSASITAFPMPTDAPGSPGGKGKARTVNFAGGSVILPMSSGGSVAVVNPSTGAVTGVFLSNSQKTVPQPLYDSVSPYDSTDDGTLVYIAFLGDWNFSVQQGDLESFNPSTNTFTTLPSVSAPQGIQPTVPSVSGSLVYYADYVKNSLDVVNLSNNTARSVPIVPYGGSIFTLPGGVAAEADGTAWSVCYGAFTPFQPLCVSHTVYFSNWTLWPSYAVAVNGAGPSTATLMGIMEAPSANSGPFTVTSGNTAVCTISNVSDHNFRIVGVAPGSCTVTVTDKNNVAQSMNAVVTTTSGTVQSRRVGGVQ